MAAFYASNVGTGSPMASLRRYRVVIRVNVEAPVLVRQYGWGALGLVPTGGGGDPDPGPVKPRPTVGLLFPAR